MTTALLACWHCGSTSYHTDYDDVVTCWECSRTAIKPVMGTKPERVPSLPVAYVVKRTTCKMCSKPLGKRKNYCSRKCQWADPLYRKMLSTAFREVNRVRRDKGAGYSSRRISA